jgi:gluconate 2-dehydrogenase gamma chain
MASKSDWPVVPLRLDRDSSGPVFFTQHEWDTIEAATARIYPTDHQPGAREAGVVHYIDRYLSGLQFIYASADGSGFLQMSGKLADAWRSRIVAMQNTYREGIQDLDARGQKLRKRNFKDLAEKDQDAIFVALSGAPKPLHIKLSDTGKLGTMLQGVSDDDASFFEMLALHTRQGMFGDPAYGGNRNRVGWDLVEFPGPKSLRDTNDCSYSVKSYFVQEYDWKDLIPHLREKSA